MGLRPSSRSPRSTPKERVQRYRNAMLKFLAPDSQSMYSSTVRSVRFAISSTVKPETSRSSRIRAATSRIL